MNELPSGEPEQGECSHSWKRLDEPRPSFLDPGIYRCEHCGYTFAEIGARIPRDALQLRD